MHRTALLFALICFILAAVGAYFGAIRAVDVFQEATEAELRQALLMSDEEWVHLRAKGLQVNLTGLAPDEAARFRVLQVIGKFVDPGRITDDITILQANDIAPPKFSLEVLRNDERISLIGLVPSDHGRSHILDNVEDIALDLHITDMLEEASFAVPTNWESALDFGIFGLQKLNRSKISITHNKVIISAVTESQTEKQRYEKELADNTPDGLELELHISAPRPVISPFTLHFTLDENGAEMAACSVDTEFNSLKIMRAAQKIGLDPTATCAIGLGVPTTEWAEAIVLSLNAVGKLGGGVLTFTDSDISLIAQDDVDEASYDQIIGALENDLPELFSLAAVLPPKPLIDGQTGDIVIPEFTATKSPEGQVQLRGRISSVPARNSVQAFAKALFGSENVYAQTRIDENLPDGWPLRVLGGLEALAELHHGTLIVQPETIQISGTGDSPSTKGAMSRILSVRVGTKDNFKLSVDYDERLAKRDTPPTPQECETQIAEILAKSKIEFDPGRVDIKADSLAVVDQIAKVLRLCPTAEFEIQGHTDNSGSEELNQTLSQSRADAVLSALLTRRVLTSRMIARGYGPSQPITDNASEASRAQNRRISFALITPVEPANPALLDASADPVPSASNAPQERPKQKEAEE
ncbi:membrane protein [Amylibacter marinus]|uniref:Membrane protein n=1 Tax=Amylibacter marinus TaxID=1475483 RepID=A0ABQ5VWV5_9RHOB|nr:OmpA family protein [Amylibacter marinus]GLQ35918.1 membrane protein [Amylibacter marinus]